MKSHCLLPWLVLFSVCAPLKLRAQSQQTAPSTPTFRLNSTLVFLDVTVLDKSGHPVVTGLTKDDVTITEDKKPQTAVSLDINREIMASRLENLDVVSESEDAARLPDIVSSFNVKLRVPPQTRTVRVVLENQENGRMGAAQLSRKDINAAPSAPTPEPQITPHRQEYAKPTTE